MMHYYGYMGYFGWFWMILFWAAVIWLIVWLAARGKEPMQSTVNPMDILKKRYANGEITKKQFEEMKKDISK